MSYKQILKKIAAEYGTTPKEVDKEIREAIKVVGLDMNPMNFIRMMSEKVKAEIEG